MSKRREKDSFTRFIITIIIITNNTSTYIQKINEHTHIYKYKCLFVCTQKIMHHDCVVFCVHLFFLSGKLSFSAGIAL